MTRKYFAYKKHALDRIWSDVQYDRTAIDYAANKVYNKVVVNGQHKPENYGEAFDSIAAEQGIERKIVDAWWTAAEINYPTNLQVIIPSIDQVIKAYEDANGKLAA